jgi:uncharacterized glyoxalase superfamily protein PhnB
MPFEITGLSPILKVTDMAQTIQFYTRTLGFTVENEMSDDTRKPTWCVLEWGSATVMSYSAESLNQPPGSPGMTAVLYFNPGDVRALSEHPKTRAELAWPLDEMPYGTLEFAIKDCNGYILSFGQQV